MIHRRSIGDLPAGAAAPSPAHRSFARSARSSRGGGALVASALALAGLLVAAHPALADHEVRVRTIEQDLPAGDVRTVSFHGSVGEVEVVGTGADSVHVQIVFKCKNDNPRCRSAAADVDLEVRDRGGELGLKLEKWPKIGDRGLEVEARLEIPRDRSIEIDWGVGEIDVDHMESDIEVDLGVGEIDVDTIEAAVRSVSMDTGVGEVELQAGERTIDGHGFVGQSLDWSGGPGDAHIELDNGVGEITVKLR